MVATRNSWKAQGFAVVREIPFVASYSLKEFEQLAYRVIEKLVSTCDDPFEDPDVVIWKFDSTGVYGIPIRNGGSAIIVIEYCPWCGIRLPKQ